MVLSLGCMAERLKKKLLEREEMVDLVCGPDAYRDLPRMLALTQSGQTAGNHSNSTGQDIVNSNRYQLSAGICCC